MTLAPGYSPVISMPTRSQPAALSVETATVEATELVELAARLHRHALRDGGAVSAMSLVAKAFLVASLRHPAIDARWPLLPDRHGLLLSELTAALDGTDAASAIPDDAAVLSVALTPRRPAEPGGGIESRDVLELRLAFDPRRSNAVEAQRLLVELAAILAEPWELVLAC